MSLFKSLTLSKFVLFTHIFTLFLSEFTLTKIDMEISNSGETQKLDQVIDAIFCFSPETSTEKQSLNLQLDFNANFQSKSLMLHSVVNNASQCIQLYASNQNPSSSTEGQFQGQGQNPDDLTSKYLHFIFMPRDLEELSTIVYQLANVQEKWRKLGQNIWTPVILIIWPDEGDKSWSQNQADVIQNALQSKLVNSSDSVEIESQIPLDSNICLVFLPVDSKHEQRQWENAPSVSIWEIYHANSHLIVNKLVDFPMKIPWKNLIQIVQEILSQTSVFSLAYFGSRRKFYGQRIKAAGVFRESDLFDFNVERLNETHVNFIDGFSVSIFWDFRDSLNFTVEGLLGHHYIRDPKIDGIGRQVLDGIIDISITPSTMLPYRAKLLHFLQPLQTERIHAYFEQPENFALQNIFTFPFSKSVWWALAFSGIALTISIILIEIQFGRNSIKRRRVEQPFQIGAFDLIFESISMLLFQSLSNLTSTTFSGKKILILAGFFQGVILFSVYSGSIISALTVKLNPVSTFDHLLQYSYIFLADTSVQFYYRAATERIEAQKVNEDTANYFKDEEDAFKKVLRVSGSDNDDDPNLYALVMESHEFYYKAKLLNYTEHEVCSAFSMTFGTTKGVAMFLNQRSPYKEFFSIKTALLLERGISHHHDARYRENVAPSCPDSSKYTSTLATSLPQVRLRDSSFAFHIMASGLSLSVLVGLCEILSVTSCRKKRKLKFKADKNP